MRTFLVLMVVVWVGSCAVSFSTGQLVFAVPLALASSLITWYITRSLPIAASTIALALLGGVLGQSHITAPPDCHITAPVTGTIRAEPRRETTRVQYQVTTSPGCTILVYGQRWPLYGQGETVTISQGELTDVDDLPADQHGYAQYLRRQGISAMWRYPTIAAHTAPAPSSRYQALAQQLEQILPEPDASLVAELVLADRGRTPREITDSFRITGTSHVLAVSGMHISILVGVLLVIISPLALPRLLTLVLMNSLFWTYIMFIGAPASALRAGIFWSCALIALELRRLMSLPSLVLLTIAILVTYRPAIMTDLGFMLSVSAVSGIFASLFLTQPLRRRLHRASTPTLWQHVVRQFSSGVSILVLTTLGATLTTAPLIAYYFQTISPSSLIANLLVIPPLSLILVVSILVLVISYVSLPIAALIAYPLHLLLQWLVNSVTFIATLPGASLTTPIPPLWFIVSYYVALLTLASIWLRTQRRSWREVWA